MFMSPAAGPVIERVRPGGMARPEVSLAGLSPTRIEILHRRLVDLHIAAGQLVSKDFLHDRLEPLRGQLHAAGQRLAGQIHAMALLEDVLLAVQRQVVGILAHQHMRQKFRRQEPSIQQLRRQRRDQRSAVRIPPPHPDAPHDPAHQKAARLIIQLLADFLTDLPIRLRIALHRVRINDFSFHRKIVRTAGSTGFSLATRRIVLGGHKRFARRQRDRRVEMTQQEFELMGIELFTFAAEHPADQHIEFLPEQVVLPAQEFVLFDELLGLGIAHAPLDNASFTPFKNIFPKTIFLHAHTMASSVRLATRSHPSTSPAPPGSATSSSVPSGTAKAN